MRQGRSSQMLTPDRRLEQMVLRNRIQLCAGCGRPVVFVALLFISQALAGCSDVDWNWDTTWWEAPRRTVRPIRPTPPGSTSGEFAYAPKTSGQYSPRPAEATSATRQGAVGGSVAATTDAAPVSPANNQSPTPPAPPPQPTPAGAVSTQAFYQLYLASSGAAEQPVPGTARLVLSRAKPRAMAAVLESLYPPMGRSGSDVESYLIYEQREEFEAARTMVAALDVPQAENGGGDAFETAVGMYFAILGQDASVDKAMVKACQAKFDEARQSGRADRQRNWAASLLKGRLASEFTYEYPVAIAAFSEAGQTAGDGTLEHMVALWWGADALRMEGGRAAAKRNLEQIVHSYGKYAQSQVVRRAKAALGQGK